MDIRTKCLFLSSLHSPFQFLWHRWVLCWLNWMWQCRQTPRNHKAGGIFPDYMKSAKTSGWRTNLDEVWTESCPLCISQEKCGDNSTWAAHSKAPPAPSSLHSRVQLLTIERADFSCQRRQISLHGTAGGLCTSWFIQSDFSSSLLESIIL